MSDQRVHCRGFLMRTAKSLIDFKRIQSSAGSQDDDEHYDGGDLGVAVVTSKPKLKKPSMYKVIMLNDDYTPMEFVVHILQKFFGMDFEKATQVMLAIHTNGNSVCGIYPRDVAETKVSMVNAYAQENQHPLLSKAEATD